MSGEKDRYSRQLMLPQVGAAGQARLRKASVLIVGLGGLGCPVAQYLAAMGVGRIGLMDHDKVQHTNLNRQLLYGPEDCGKLKVDIAAAKLRAQNPEVQYDCYPFAFTIQTDEKIISSYDLLIDASDNMDTKYAINDLCVALNLPWVGASLHKFEGQIAVYNLNNSPSYRCLFPKQEVAVPSCEEAGVLGTVPGLLGMKQAMEAVKILLNIGKPFAGILKTIDFLNDSEFQFSFTRSEAQIGIALENWKARNEPSKINLPDLNGFYLDVREPSEEPKLSHKNLLQIPLSELSTRSHEVPVDEPVFVFCKTGKRSQQAIELLLTIGNYENLNAVEGGYISLLKTEKV